MSDWDFLYEMHERGYSAQELADAAGAGMAPWEHENLPEDWIDSQFGELGDPLEWIEEVEAFRSREGLPWSILEQIEIFDTLVDCARRHIENTGRYLQIWGELGEIYAEIKFGLRRHESRRPGSDGTIKGRLVEVKTISPEKSNNQAVVKNEGDFEQLLIVRIDRDFRFQGKLFERTELAGASGKRLRARFDLGSGGY